MELAKDALDVGLLTDDAAMVAFFAEEVGLGEPEPLLVAHGMTQHRFDVLGSVVKVNVVSELPVESRSGYASVILAGEAFGEPRTLRGPDGVLVELVHPGALGVERLGVRLGVPDLAAAEAYFRRGLGWEASQGRVRVGSTVLLLDEHPDAPTAVQMPVRGWTYLTVQVFDCDAVTEQVVAQGVTLAAAPRTLGDVARFSMVADPWGNWLEISERSSVTGFPIGRR